MHEDTHEYEKLDTNLQVLDNVSTAYDDSIQSVLFVEFEPEVEPEVREILGKSEHNRDRLSQGIDHDECHVVGYDRS